MTNDLLNKLNNLLNKVLGNIKFDTLLDKLDKLQDKLYKLDKQKIILVALIACTILYLDFAFIIRMQWRFIKRTGPKIVGLKSEIKTLINDSARLPDLESSQARIRQEIAPKVKRLISKEQIPLLLQFISDTANENDVNVLQMSTSKDLKAEPSTSFNLSPVLISLSISAGYHRLGKFIDELENAEDFLAVEEVKITRGTVSDLKQDAALFLKTYVKQ